MLSYQHGYHAGNLADVQKHALLSFVLAYMTQKDKPLSYIETHSGRGLYDLTSDEAAKTGESLHGIQLMEQDFPAHHPYRRIIADTRDLFGKTIYPGSPLVAALSLRPDDQIHLAELHPQEFDALRRVFMNWDADIQKRDGFEMALAITPPVPRRGILMVDPSYEVKEDYDRIPGFLGKIARKWNVGILALWYPILTTNAHLAMVGPLLDMFPELFRHELRFPAVRPGHKMVGTGMIFINPPFGLEQEAEQLTKIFARHCKQDGKPSAS